MSSTTPPQADDADETTLIAAQQAFLKSGSKPAAKILRASSPKRTHPQAPANTEPASTDGEGNEWSKAPGWYEQMKGVRFRLDDLEGDDEDLESFADRTGSKRKDKPVVDRKEGAGPVMGDIVERTTSTAAPVFTPRGPQKSTAGFPAPRKFAGRLQAKSPRAPSRAVPVNEGESGGEAKLEGKELMEEIDRENRKKMAEMSEEEILEAQRMLQASLSPKFMEMLSRKDKAQSTSQYQQSSTTSTAPPQKAGSSPRPTVAPSQPPKPTAAAPTSTSQSKTSTINDPFMDDKSFDDHLRTFFPPTTTSIPRPEWTLPVHPAEETFYSQPDASVPDATTMRFDFQGKHIPPQTSRSLPTHLGLHHHSLNPGAAGYTLAELAILARSIQPSQKCIALKILGFVLADVAGGEYPWDVQEELWDEIERERVIEILLEVAKGGRETGGNRSVQKYAEDAVTRWVNADGPKQWEERLKKKGFERIPDAEAR